MALGREVLGPRRPEFWQDAPEYHGALAAAGAWRLAVSPHGKRYLLQERLPNGRFRVRRWRKQLSKLAPDVPEALRPALAVLPDCPGDLHRPWADVMAAERERLRRESPARDEYRGAICVEGAARLATSPKGREYWLQVRGRDGRWSTLKRSRCLADIRPALVLCPEGLVRACERLPELASDYRGAQDGRQGRTAARLPAPIRKRLQGRALALSGALQRQAER